MSGVSVPSRRPLVLPELLPLVLPELRPRGALGLRHPAPERRQQQRVAALALLAGAARVLAGHLQCRGSKEKSLRAWGSSHAGSIVCLDEENMTNR